MKRDGIFIILVVLVLIAVPGNAQEAGADRPNLLFIMADDMGWQDASCFGDAAVETPNIDALAADGMKWTQFYAAAPVCTPTRTSVLTGRYPLRFNIQKHFSKDSEWLTEKAILLPELLGEAGYFTAHMGKWHLGGTRPHQIKARRRGKEDAPPGPLEHGFDHYLGIAEGSDRHKELARKNKLYQEAYRIQVRNDRPVKDQAKKFRTKLIADEAISLIDRSRENDKPFFLNIWFQVPHKPYEQAPEPHWSDTAAEGISDDQHRFRSMMACMDVQIGRIVNQLKKRNLYDETLIVFTSDNGAAYEGRIGPLKGGKTDLHEGGIRVPGIFTWPGRIPAGTETDTLGHTNDILPTFCAAAGVELPEEKKVDGVNLLGHLTNGKSIDRGTLLWQSKLYSHLQRHYEKPKPYVTEAARRGPWKLVSRDGEPKALYNLERDIREEKNFMDEHPDVVSRLKKKMKTFLNAPRVDD